MIASAGISFDPLVSGRRLTFGFHGIYQATVVMYDHQTDSLWMQMTGECFSGELAGAVLDRLPTGRHTTWDDWEVTHPGTDVMKPDPAFSRRYFHRHRAWSGTASFPAGFRATLYDRDPRLEPPELVLGVEATGRARAYPLVRMRKVQVVEEDLGGIPATIWFDVKSRSAAAFDARAGGVVRSFRPHEPGVIEETRTGSLFNMEGECTSGALRGTRLTPLTGHLAEWFGWFVHHQNTTLWGS
jgi:hypothetical protein